MSLVISYHFFSPFKSFASIIPRSTSTTISLLIACVNARRDESSRRANINVMTIGNPIDDINWPQLLRLFPFTLSPSFLDMDQMHWPIEKALSVPVQKHR